MDKFTRKQITALELSVAAQCSTDNVKETFSVTPAVAQKIVAAARQENTFLSRINVLMVKDQQGEAIATCRLALDKVESSSWIERELLSRIERIHQQNGIDSALISYYKKLIAENPTRTSYQHRLAQVLEKEGYPEEAIAIYQKLLKLLPGDKKIRESYIKLLTQTDINKATTAVRLLLQQFPADRELMLTASNVEYLADHKPQVTALLTKYVASKPTAAATSAPPECLTAIR